MKIISILALVLLCIASCTGRNGTHQVVCDDPQTLHNPILDDVNSTNIERKHDEKEDCEKVSYKGEIQRDDHRLSISYAIRTKDSLGKKLSKQEAYAFMITLDLGRKGATEVTSMEIEIKDEKFTFLPTFVQNNGNGTFWAIFSPDEYSSLAACLNKLAYSNEMQVKAHVKYDNGAHRLVQFEYWQLRNMARSYLIDGGKFE